MATTSPWHEEQKHSSPISFMLAAVMAAARGEEGMNKKKHTQSLCRFGAPLHSDHVRCRFPTKHFCFSLVSPSSSSSSAEYIHLGRMWRVGASNLKKVPPVRNHRSERTNTNVESHTSPPISDRHSTLILRSYACTGTTSFTSLPKWPGPSVRPRIG